MLPSFRHCFVVAVAATSLVAAFEIGRRTASRSQAGGVPQVPVVGRDIEVATAAPDPSIPPPPANAVEAGADSVFGGGAVDQLLRILAGPGGKGAIDAQIDEFVVALDAAGLESVFAFLADKPFWGAYAKVWVRAVEHWAGLDPVGAADFSFSLTEESYMRVALTVRVLGVWAEREPATAWGWLQGQEVDRPLLRRQLMTSLLEHAAAGADPGFALGLLEEDPSLGRFVPRVARSAYENGAGELFEDWMDRLPEGRLKGEAILAAQAEAEPVPGEALERGEAVARLERLRGTADWDRGVRTGEALAGWLASDPEGVLDWVSENRGHPAVRFGIENGWGRGAFPAFADLAGANTDGHLDWAIALSRQVGQDDPARYWECLQEIRDDDLRRFSSRRFYHSWSEGDPGGHSAFFSGEERPEVEAWLKERAPAEDDLSAYEQFNLNLTWELPEALEQLERVSDPGLRRDGIEKLAWLAGRAPELVDGSAVVPETPFEVLVGESRFSEAEKEALLQHVRPE